jgi:hypothetical protein
VAQGISVPYSRVQFANRVLGTPEPRRP